MKVLIVDQFGKTVGRDTLALADLINCSDVEMTAFLSDTTELPKGKNYACKIVYGFRGAYEGNAINKAKNYIKSLKELRKYIEKEKFDIVHLQWFSLPWIEWLYVGKLRKKAKIVITVHDVIPFDCRPLELKALNAIYKRADAICIHTETAKKKFEEIYTARSSLNVVTQGFCYKPDFVKINQGEAREKLNIPKDAIVFLYYGTIRPSKGLESLFNAVIKAQQVNQKVYLLAAGAFHKVDEEIYNNLAEKVKKVGARVDFGFVPFELEKYYFSSADVLALPYLEGTQSGVAQLGLMYELPLIASSINGLDGVAVDGENSLRYKAGNVDELTEKILTYATDAELRNNHGMKSKKLGEEEFSLIVKAERVRNVYKKIMQN